MAKRKKKSIITQKPNPKYDMETAYVAAATIVSLIVSTREAFVIREFDIRNDKFEFEYCFPDNPEGNDTRRDLAYLCEILGEIAGHALFSGEILGSEVFGFDDQECIDHMDNQAKILIDLCQNKHANFFQDLVQQLSKHGWLCGDRIEESFLKHFEGEIGEAIDVEFRKN